MAHFGENLLPTNSLFVVHYHGRDNISWALLSWAKNQPKDNICCSSSNQNKCRTHYGIRKANEISVLWRIGKVATWWISISICSSGNFTAITLESDGVYENDKERHKWNTTLQTLPFQLAVLMLHWQKTLCIKFSPILPRAVFFLLLSKHFRWWCSIFSTEETAQHFVILSPFFPSERKALKR